MCVGECVLCVWGMISVCVPAVRVCMCVGVGVWVCLLCMRACVCGGGSCERTQNTMSPPLHSSSSSQAASRSACPLHSLLSPSKHLWGSPCSTLCWLTLLHPVLAHPAPPCAGSPCSTLCWLPLLRPVLAHPAPPPGPPRTAGGDPDVGPRRVQQLTPHCGPGAYFSPSACPPLTWPALGGSSPWGI